MTQNVPTRAANSHGGFLFESFSGASDSSGVGPISGTLSAAGAGMPRVASSSVAHSRIVSVSICPNSFKYPVNSARSQMTLIRRGVPPDNLYISRTASAVKRSFSEPATFSRCRTYVCVSCSSRGGKVITDGNSLTDRLVALVHQYAIELYLPHEEDVDKLSVFVFDI